MSEYIAKASIEPRDYRVVFLIQKLPTAQLSAVFYFSVLLIIQSESVMDGDHRFFRIFLINQNRDPDF